MRWDTEGSATSATSNTVLKAFSPAQRILSMDMRQGLEAPESTFQCLAVVSYLAT